MTSMFTSLLPEDVTTDAYPVMRSPRCRGQQRAIPLRRRGPDFAAGAGQPPDIASASQRSQAQSAAVGFVATSLLAARTFSSKAVRARPLGDFAIWPLVGVPRGPTRTMIGNRRP